MGAPVGRVQPRVRQLGGGAAAAGQGALAGRPLGGAHAQDRALGGDTRAERPGRVRAGRGACLLYFIMTYYGIFTYIYYIDFRVYY